MSNQSGKASPERKSIDKGKGRAEPGILGPYHEASHGDEPLARALDEALRTPLPPVTVESSLESSFDRTSPISAPPQAHYSVPLRPRPNRLLSQLTRSTLPASTSQYAARERSVTHGGYPTQGESSSAWRTSPTTAVCDEPFPDLDPTTGLPAPNRRASIDSDAPSLHLQRTITDLLQSPAKEPSSFLPFNLATPRVQLPGRPSLDTGRPASSRSVSSSAPQQDWSSWATSWWSGNKAKVDSQLAPEDQADTVEEEAEKHRRKCE